MRSFRDSNGDGTGDFKGLTEKLDLQWLGVDCLGCRRSSARRCAAAGTTSPTTNILPECGSVEDFHTFLDEAHKRDIRVIIDFVMNHTRPAPVVPGEPGGPGRAVRRLLRVVGHRRPLPGRAGHLRRHRAVELDVGPGPAAVLLAPVLLAPAGPELPGPRGHARGDLVLVRHGPRRVPLDAVPYLYERPGTNGENLPETHQFLKMVRTYVDEHYPGRVLLAEANQWPADVVDYFGDFEKGRRVPHVLPLPGIMPRIFMAVRRESRFPISEILEQTPPIPSGTQWGIFLRNHDELTLEMVSDEDRDYMWGEYAKDPRMKANIGIRRRLAPLLDNDINQIELFNALLPGSPSSTTATRSGWATTSGSGTATACARRCSGRPTATPASRPPPPAAPPAGHPGPGLRLLERQRRGAGARTLVPALDPPDDPGPSPARRVRARLVHRPRRLEPDGAVLRPRPRPGRRPPRRHPVRQQPTRFPQPVELDLRRWEGMVPFELLGGVPSPPSASSHASSRWAATASTGSG